MCCDLLENIYLCGINNNISAWLSSLSTVVICLKISTFVVSTTTDAYIFALRKGCDLLENIYLCGINNNEIEHVVIDCMVVICLKISTFVVSTTTKWQKFFDSIPLWFAWKYLPLWYQQQLCPYNIFPIFRCDLLENIYLCGINNNFHGINEFTALVVICLKISTFVVSTTTSNEKLAGIDRLWFAWKYLPLWYQQQLIICNLLFIKMI